MTEYVGLDLEMAVEEHYHEVLDVIDNMFKHVFETLYTRYEKEMKIVQDAFDSSGWRRRQGYRSRKASRF